MRDLDLLFHAAAIEIVPFDEEHLLLAHQGYERSDVVPALIG